MSISSVRPRRWLTCAIAVAIATQAAAAQQRPNPYVGDKTSPSTAPATPAAPTTPTFKPEELEQVVAGIALYPDSLVSQVLMASTYPVEVVQAERWAKENKGLKGDALAKELEKQTWDPSVKSLVNFPEVLTMMSEKLDWTVKLGDAFIAQQKDVMDTIQRLRAKAKDQGNLASNSQQNVKVDAAPATQAVGGTATTTQVITIESTNPEVVYVPTYNPTVVYGGWPYPSYPPYYYYPPTYVPGQAAVAFGVGVAIGAAWGYAWGGCNWGHGDVDIDIDQNININNNIDRDKYKAERDARQSERQGNRSERQGNRDGTGRANSFQHDPSHRKGVAYRDQATAQRFGGASSDRAIQARDAYRGRAEAGRQDMARGGADSYRSGAGASARDTRSSYGGSGSSYGNRSSSSANRSSQTGTRSGAFDSAGSSGRQTRSYSDRGHSSRSGASSGGGGSRSAPARSGGGGGGRGGGGRGGGGRR